jgi:hypothetical protein
MASFADENNKLTLIVQRFGPAEKPDDHRFKLNGIMQITLPDGTNYLSALPSDTHALIGLTFDRIEFVEPLGVHADEESGGFDFTHYAPDYNIGKIAR